ncbi:mucin-2-like isoform X2 [Dermacentor albipictus]|uniref:mucin-2-like isoform X2 n=1 Tax=Dermacentor albipictus TaxID=60249 RepID=UPI0038FC49FA
MTPKLKVAAVLLLWTFTGRCIAGPLGDATASRRHAPRSNAGGHMGFRTQRSGALDEKPHVVHPTSQDPTANIPEKEEVINTPNEGSLREPPTRYQLPQTVSSPKPPEQNDPKPQVVNLSHEPVYNLAEKPQVLFGSERDSTHNTDEKTQVVNPPNEPVKNLDEKPQVVNPDLDPVGNYKEKPNTLKATYPDVARSIDRRLGSPIKDTSTKTQERPQVPPRVPLPARPYGERDPVPQIPVPPSQSTINNAHRPPYGGDKQNYPGPPRWPAYPRPPFGYGVPVGNVQVPTTPRPPSCFYKSERYEHGDSVETPEPCLNCTCQKGVLVCYLRVCPVIGTPAPGCFTAREAGQCCPSVFCSGDKKSETTTTPPPPTDDDYYDYPATVDYEAEATTTTTTTTTTTRRPVTTSTRRYSFAPKPVKRPYDSGMDEVELSARTPSVIVEQTEQSTTAEVDVATTTTELPSTTTTTTTEAAQTSPEATTTGRPTTAFAPTTTQQHTAGTASSPKHFVTVTAIGITPTATTSLPVTTTTTVSTGLSGSNHRDGVDVTQQSDSPASRPNARPSAPTATSPSTTTSTASHETSTPPKSTGQDTGNTIKPEVLGGGPNVVVTTTAGVSAVAAPTESPFDSDEALADAGHDAGTTSPNEVEAPVRKPLTEEEPANSVEGGLQGGGRDSVMFVSSTPMPFELHHSFDLQDLNSVSGAQGPNATTPLPPPSTSASTTTSTTTTTTTTTTSTTTEGPVVIPIQGCWKKGNLYRVGEPIPGTKDCETCFCSPRGPLCQRIECPPVALDCEPVIPRGHCCPTEYICNKTQVRKDNEYLVPGLDKSVHHSQASPDEYRESQPLPRKSDGTLDYNLVPQPAYRPPTTQETPLLDSNVATEKTTTALHTELPSHTTTTIPVTRFAPTPTMREKQPIFLAVNNENQGISMQPALESSSLRPITGTGTGSSKSEDQTKAATETPAEKKTPIYKPAFLDTNNGHQMVNESITEANATALPSLSLLYRNTAGHPNDSTKHLQQDSDPADRPAEPASFLDQVNKSPPTSPQEGLQFSDLIDRVFFPGKDEKKESGDVNLQTAQLSPVYSQAHLYNATSLGASVIEARYPVKENDTLQPVYGTVPAYHRPTAESSIGEAGSLKPLYGKPPSFREESSDELISQMHTQVSTNAEVHYEPASSLDTDMPSTNKSLVAAAATNSTVESSKPQSKLSYQNGTEHEQGKRPHISILPTELTPIYYDVRKYTTTTRRPSTTQSTQGSTAHLSTMTTSGTTVHAHRTSIAAAGDALHISNESHIRKEAPESHPSLKTTAKPDYNIWELMYFNRSAPTVEPTEPNNMTETNVWKIMFFNQSWPTAEPTEVDNVTDSSNEITKKISPDKPTEEVGFTTSVIKVRVGNTLNVSVDSSNQSKYRNVEEDGIIVSVYPEHQMDGGVTDLQDMPLQGQVESRAISSGSLYKGIQHSGDKAKSPAELTQVISDIIKAHKSEEPEVITAPNIDFSKQNIMTVKVTPSNSFNVFSLVLLDKNGTNKHGTISTTEPPVDTAPWAPMDPAAEDTSIPKHSAEYDHPNLTGSGTLSSTESYEPQASLTVQTKQLPNIASSETVEHPEKPALHSTFRIVPFLAEDAIFKPATTTQSSMVNYTGAYSRIVNTEPRDTMEDNCFVDGHLFVNGEMIKKENPCELCRCYYGRELCQQKNCPLPPSPACISESVPGFCCPKYTCRPEDVYFPPDTETTPAPDNLVQQYTVNVWSARNPTRHAGFAGVHSTAQQPGPAGRKSTPPWHTTSSFSLKNSPTLKPYLLQRHPSPQEPHNRFSHLHSTEESSSYKETTPPPPTTTTTEPPTTSQSPSSSQQLWNIFQVSGCNIYGRLYGVNEVVRELSSKCKACTCTSLGVQCNETC